MRLMQKSWRDLGAVTLVACGALLGCGSHTPSASGNVTATGGMVSTSDGTSVVVPAGAVTQNTPITIAGEPNAISIAGTTLLGAAYRFGPEGAQFAQPVTVTVAFDPSKLPMGRAATEIEIMTAPVGSSSFVRLETTVADATHVRAATTHFSDFVATLAIDTVADLGTTPAPDLSTPGDLSDADLTTPPDLTSACPHTWTAASCTLSANATGCGGTRSLNCAQTICYCSGGPNMGKTCPKLAPNTNMLTCPSQADVESVWTSCCGFP